MPYSFTVTYNDSLVAAAAARMSWRRTGPVYVAALLLLSVSVVTQLAADDRSWFTGTIGTVLALGILVPLLGLLVQWRSSLRKSRELEGGRAEITLTQERLRFAGRNGAVEYPWSQLLYVARYPNFWLVGPSKHQLFIVSLNGFPHDAQVFMLQQVGAHGGRVA